MENFSIIFPIISGNEDYNKSIGVYSVVVCPDKEHVKYIENVTHIIKEVLEKEFNIETKTLEDMIKPQESNLGTIFELLNGCILGIVILDGLRPNVVWEY